MEVDVRALRRRIEMSGDLDQLRSALLFAISALEEHGDEEILNDIDWEVD